MYILYDKLRVAICGFSLNLLVLTELEILLVRRRTLFILWNVARILTIFYVIRIQLQRYLRVQLVMRKIIADSVESKLLLMQCLLILLLLIILRHEHLLTADRLGRTMTVCWRTSNVVRSSTVLPRPRLLRVLTMLVKTTLSCASIICSLTTSRIHRWF